MSRVHTRRILGLPWPYVRHYPVKEVSSRNASAEVDPREVGLSQADVGEIWSAMERLYETRLHPAVALCLRRHGKVVIDGAIGHVRGNAPTDEADAPKVAATPASLFNIYSASKAVTAMVIHLLDDRGLLHLDDAVAEYIPEFARHGKEWITLRHILTHRAGIPSVPPGTLDLDILCDPKRAVELLCDAHPVSLPGRRLAYHAVTGGYILGEIVERITGVNLRTFLRREVLDPLGFKHFGYGVRPEEIPLVAVNAFTGPPAVPPLSWLLHRALGVTVREAADISNDPRFMTGIVPSGNIIGTADETSRFFQLLLNQGELDGVRVFSARTVRRAIAAQSFLEFDATLGMPISYGMGFMLGSKWWSLYGHDTEHAFGHLGFTSVVCWADPARDISVSVMTSGKPFITPGQLQWINVARTIARKCAKVTAT